MKFFKHIYLIFLISTGFAQTNQSTFIPVEAINLNERNTSPQVQSGSCASANGTMQQTIITPPDYAWLQTNGYCYAIGPQKNFTACFTFTATGANISLNAGYSTTGCASISFSNLKLYTCAPACTFVGSGINFAGLTQGQCYTWCFSGSCTGPGPGFDHICPYFMDNTPLPVEMLYFKCQPAPDGISIFWQTETETNNKEFAVQHSYDAINFNDLTIIPGCKTTFAYKKYEYKDMLPQQGANYYRVKQTDYNGTSTYSAVCTTIYSGTMPLTEYYNLQGQKINYPQNGVFIEKISKGDYVRFTKIVK